MEIIGAGLLLMSQGEAGDKVRIPIALEGQVCDENGRPVEGVLITVSEGSYTTQGETSVIPLISPRSVGAIVIDDPNVTKIHYYNTHFTRTDKKGNYQFKTLSSGRYTFSARGMKKYVGDFTTTERGLVPNKKLLAMYLFPPAERIVIVGGQTTTKNVLLRPSKVAEVCIVPRPPGANDARFIDAFAVRAARGNTEAMRMLGYAYQGQRGILPNASQAACWFRKAAAQGDLEAKRSLSQLGETVY